MLAVSDLLFLAALRSPSQLLLWQNVPLSHYTLVPLTGKFGNPRWWSEHHLAITCAQTPLTTYRIGPNGVLAADQGSFRREFGRIKLWIRNLQRARLPV